MKKILSILVVLSFVFLFVGCESEAPNNASGNLNEYTIDYDDALTFEKALNDGANVDGNIVRFVVAKYAPDSILGINCHGGEHLNFIFEEEPNVKQGDTVVVRIVESPSKVFLVDSWKIQCELLKVIENGTENEIESNNVSSSGKIKMPKNSEEYCNEEWTIEELTNHFKELGFKNINTVPCEPDNDNYEKNIFEIYIKTGFFSTNPWKQGEEYKSDAEISIYYNEFPVLTKDNCPDLVKALTSKEISYIDFATKYNGRYVKFDGYIMTHLTYDGGTSHVIEVSGGDYDGGQLEILDNSQHDSLLFYIGDRTWGNSINKSVIPGDNVTVNGKIDLEWTQYFKNLYVETIMLSKR